MIPETVRFTGLTVPTGKLAFKLNKRKVQAPYPGSWSRVEVTKAAADQASSDRLDEWLDKNMSARWGHYVPQGYAGLVLFFESEADAVLFKLMDGDQHWAEVTVQTN